MNIEYQADFIEAAINCCLAGRRPGLSALMITRFHLERERVYRLRDLDGRDAAFQQLHLKWFQEWGLAETLRAQTRLLARIEPQLTSLTYRKANGRKDEGAELYGDAEGARRVVVALRGERFEDDDSLGIFLRHEIFHVCDMLDPAFGYQLQLTQPGATATQCRLALERYRVLWDAAIDARLSRAGHPIGSTRSQHAALIDQVFSFWPTERRAALLARIWNERAVTHALLAGYSIDPRERDARGPAPGQPCPLCGMPTFHWANHHELAAVAARITTEFAAWTAEQGACARCVEVYGAALALNGGQSTTTQPPSDT